MCRKAIITGEQLYVVDENKFLCERDFNQNSESYQNKLLNGKPNDFSLRSLFFSIYIFKQQQQQQQQESSLFYDWFLL